MTGTSVSTSHRRSVSDSRAYMSSSNGKSTESVQKKKSHLAPEINDPEINKDYRLGVKINRLAESLEDMWNTKENLIKNIDILLETYETFDLMEFRAKLDILTFMITQVIINYFILNIFFTKKKGKSGIGGITSVYI